MLLWICSFIVLLYALFFPLMMITFFEYIRTKEHLKTDETNKKIKVSIVVIALLPVFLLGLECIRTSTVIALVILGIFLYIKVFLKKSENVNNVKAYSKEDGQNCLPKHSVSKSVNTNYGSPGSKEVIRNNESTTRTISSSEEYAQPSSSKGTEEHISIINKTAYGSWGLKEVTKDNERLLNSGSYSGECSLEELFARDHGMCVCGYCEAINSKNETFCVACGKKIKS